ncbi:hypothetical protein CRG98_021208 [Punica granatum]|uniref:Uncharacterized protein n=1 Tax=Punica granatum TaxID=22663 RepID=A0A2I0JR55_PUNGR|nr:hypothetical protein CRG98_021208 [Punica granatum]
MFPQLPQNTPAEVPLQHPPSSRTHTRASSLSSTSLSPFPLSSPPGDIPQPTPLPWLNDHDPSDHFLSTQGLTKLSRRRVQPPGHLLLSLGFVFALTGSLVFFGSSQVLGTFEPSPGAIGSFKRV